jgi:hypothetical protein
MPKVSLCSEPQFSLQLKDTGTAFFAGTGNNFEGDWPMKAHVVNPRCVSQAQRYEGLKVLQGKTCAGSSTSPWLKLSIESLGIPHLPRLYDRNTKIAGVLSFGYSPLLSTS